MKFLSKKWTIFIVLTIVMFISGCSSDKNTTSNENNENELAVYSVEVAEVEKGILTNDIRLTGTVMAEKIIPVVPMLTGEAIAVHVKNGDTVKKGDKLLEIDASDMEMNVIQAKAGLEATEANLRSLKLMREQGIAQAEMQVEQAEKAYEMITNVSFDEVPELSNIPEELQGIFERIMMINLPTEEDKVRAELAVKQSKMALEQAKSTAQIDAAEASVTQAKIAVQMAEKQQKNAVVTAPLSGKVTNFSTTVGEFVTPQLPLMQIVKMEEPVIYINVNEMMLPHFTEGKNVDIYIPSLKETFVGIVTNIGLMPTEQSRAYPVELKLLTSDERLRVGMVAELYIHTDLTEEQPLIPVRALLTENGESFVYVTKDGKTVERRVITIGHETSDQFEVINGLKEGEFIIVSGQHQLYDGANIDVRNEASFNF